MQCKITTGNKQENRRNNINRRAVKIADTGVMGGKPAD